VVSKGVPNTAPVVYALPRLRNRGGELELLVKDHPDWLEPHVELAALYYRLRRPEDGANERQIVDSLSGETAGAGPGAEAPSLFDYGATVICFPEYCTTLSGSLAGFTPAP
jgi:hypothetical protein